jgi:hypothetical protein
MLATLRNVSGKTSQHFTWTTTILSFLTQILNYYILYQKVQTNHYIHKNPVNNFVVVFRKTVLGNPAQIELQGVATFYFNYQHTETYNTALWTICNDKHVYIQYSNQLLAV